MKNAVKIAVSAVMILALTLVSALAVIPISAEGTPEGTPIADAVGFAAMSADGTYYLSGDITLSGAYASDFTGKLDGNGHKITVNGAPVFNKIKGGTVKNLTVVGSIENTGKDICGGLADTIEGGTVEKVTVDYDITVKYLAVDGSALKGYAGGIAAVVTGTVKLSEVVTEGTINVNSIQVADAGKIAFGGMIGTADTANLTVEKCENKGSVISAQNANIGGIVGRSYNTTILVDESKNTAELKGFAGGNFQQGLGGIVGLVWNNTNAAPTVNFKKCENHGKLLSYEGTTDRLMAGGIVGLAYVAPHVNIENCKNLGEIDIACNNPGAWAGIGGILGCALDSRAFTNWTVTIKNCENVANVTGGNIGGILGGNFGNVKVDDAKLSIENCVNRGELKSKNGANAGGILCGLRTAEASKLSNISIKNCMNEGNVTGASYAGGIIGYMDYTGKHKPTVDSCLNAGNIHGAKNSAGVFGTTATNAVVKNSVNAGDITGATAAVLAPIVNEVNGIECADCIYVSGCAEGSFTLGTAKTDSEVDAKIATMGFLRLNDNGGIEKDIRKAKALKEIDYTASSWALLTAALKKAEAASANGELGQEEMDAAETELENAIAGLVIIAPNFTAFDAKMAEAKAVDKSKWSSSTYVELQLVMEKYKDLRDKNGALCSEVMTAVEELSAAISGLKPATAVKPLDRITGDVTLPGLDIYLPTEAPTTAKPTETNAATKPADEEGGCGGIIGGTAIVIAVAAVGMTALAKKKED